jgi:hypothetical protein
MEMSHHEPRHPPDQWDQNHTFLRGPERRSNLQTIHSKLTRTLNWNARNHDKQASAGDAAPVAVSHLQPLTIPPRQ